MINNFPDINIPESKKKDEFIKDYIDAVVDYYKNTLSENRSKFQKIYNSYNGVSPSIAKNYIEKAYGKSTSTPIIRYRLGRTKIKLLLGEMLDFKFDRDVEATNPEAVTKKLAHIPVLLGAMQVKEDLQAVGKAFGFNILDGLEIPEANDPDLFNKLSPKQQAESFMQAILDEKLEEDELVRKAYEFFTFLILVSQCHAVVDTDKAEVDRIRVIPPENAIYMEVEGDPYAEESPFNGERMFMYEHQILAKFPKISATDKEKLKDMVSLENSGIQTIGGQPLYPVYYVEFTSPRPFYTKTSYPKDSDVPYETNIDAEYYEKNEKKIQKDVNKMLYTVSVQWGEQIHKGYRIGDGGDPIYLELGRKQNVIQTKGSGKKYFAKSDYTHLLFGTIGNTRVSIQELIYNLDEVYDIIMWQILRELKKIKGQVFVYDESLVPSGMDMSGVLYDVVEHGVLKINSAEEGNLYGREVENAANVIKELNLGVSDSLKELINMKLAIEQTVDRITGINEDREGQGKASITATGAMQNIEASRNITKDAFFFINEFMEKILTKLCEKVKLNKEYISRTSTYIKYGDNLIDLGNLIDELYFSEFGVYLSDGKKIQEIKERIRQYFPVEINSGALRTKDVIRFEMAKDLNMGLKVLDDAWEQVQQMQTMSIQQKAKSDEAKIAQGIQIAREDREDKQAHDIVMEEEKRKTEAMKLGAKGLMESAKNRVNLQKDKNKEKSNDNKN